MPKSRTSPNDIKYLKLVQHAINLRVAGVSYAEIIEKLGHWSSISACQKAVAAALAKEHGLAVEAGRNEIVARNEARIFRLMDKFDKSGSVIVSREITRIDDQTARLKGYFAPTKIAETDVKGNDKPRVIVYLPDNGRDSNPAK